MIIQRNWGTRQLAQLFLQGGVPKEDFDFAKCSRAHFGDQKAIFVVQLLPKQQTVEQVCGVTWGALR